MRRVLISVLLLGLVAGGALADGPETGVVSGTVTDTSGAPLPGAGVTITGGRGEKFTQTEEDGSYRFALLVPGSYVVKASLEGMGEAEQAVQVTAGQRFQANLSLKLATAETITVTSEAPLVDKFNVGVGATMQSQVGVEVTGENRSYYGVVNFMPGVTNDDENVDLSSTRPNINGSTWADSTVYIDGVDTTFARYGGSRVFLPSSATTEVSLESGGLSADYGRTVGSATNVIVKSGTNVFHGQALVGLTEEKWNGEYDLRPELQQRQTNQRPADFFKRTSEEKENDDTQYEVSLGGPLKRDKAWFFLSANEINTNHTGKTVNGDFVDESGVAESRIVKLNLQPSTNHALSVSYIDTPVLRNFVLEPVFDRYAVTPHDISGELYTASYNVSLSSKFFLEAKLADQTSNENKLLAVGGHDIEEAIRIKQQDPRFPGNPAAGVDWPGNNYSAYLDSDGWHNGWLLDNGFGTNEFPRSQFNLAFTQFVAANHELKYGLDAQQVEWLGDVERPNLYSGQGDNLFSSTSRSGFVNPFSENRFRVACDFTTGDSCIIQDYHHPSLLADLGSNDTTSTNIAAYWRDRFTLGDHFTFNVGLRAENQNHENDTDREVMDSTDVSPRVSVAYDISGDGRRLITGYVGRSYHQLPQQAINEYLQDQFNGYNGYERRLFLDCAYVACVPAAPTLRFPLPLGYGFSLGFIRPGFMWDLVDAGVFESDLEPYHKNEAILGYEWQFSRNWAFDGKAIWWEVENLIGSTLQLAELNGRLALFHLTANHEDYPAIMNAVREAASPAIQPRLAQADALALYEEPSRDYRALQMQVNRRFSGNWALYSNVTWSEAGGSSHGDVFNNTNDSYGEQLEQVLTQDDIDDCVDDQLNRT
ncbi:MAG TPA: TonB-dependent receptor, partial [Thermoanaerobaculia bacterium]|nr:TonB-dependent receptor [Thermoanaerobaculia bacterium]